MVVRCLRTIRPVYNVWGLARAHRTAAALPGLHTAAASSTRRPARRSLQVCTTRTMPPNITTPMSLTRSGRPPKPLASHDSRVTRTTAPPVAYTRETSIHKTRSQNINPPPPHFLSSLKKFDQVGTRSLDSLTCSNLARLRWHLETKLQINFSNARYYNSNFGNNFRCQFL